MLLDLEAAPGAESVKPFFVATPGFAGGAAISPNGEWFAYRSTESGARRAPHREVPRARAKNVGVDRIQPHSGLVARWAGALLHGSQQNRERRARHDGRWYELTPTLRVSAPRRLFSAAFETGVTDMGRTFGIAPDGRRFLWCETHRVCSPSARSVAMQPNYSWCRTGSPSCAETEAKAPHDGAAAVNGATFDWIGWLRRKRRVNRRLDLYELNDFIGTFWPQSAKT